MPRKTKPKEDVRPWREGDEDVKDHQARSLVSLVRAGVEQGAAEAQTGTTLAALRADGSLTAATKSLLARAENAGILKDTDRRAIANARLVELAMQDDDIRVAATAARALLGVEGPKVAVQFNNIIRDKAVVDSLRSLGILELEESEEVIDATDHE